MTNFFRFASMCSHRRLHQFTSMILIAFESSSSISASINRFLDDQSGGAFAPLRSTSSEGTSSSLEINSSEGTSSSVRAA